MSELITVRNVRKYFAVPQRLLSRKAPRFVRAVDDVDLDIHSDETVALVGESGSGKTTLGLMILSLLDPTGGSIEWNGRPLRGLSAPDRMQFHRDVQVVFQNPFASLNPRNTIVRILHRPLLLHRIVPAADIESEIRRLLDVVGLRPVESFLRRHPHELSGGQRQRVAIARALALRPRMIVADEPVSALDVSVRAQILNLLHDIKRDFGLAMLFTTHDLGVVRYIADRVAVMYLGKLVELAPRDRFFSDPRHPYTQMLLGSALSPDPHADIASRRVEVRGEPPSAIDPPSGCRFRTRCPHAMARCAVEEPHLRDVAEDHRVACFLEIPNQRVTLTATGASKHVAKEA